MAFAHKKSLGQHFLNNPHIPRRMADAAAIQKGDTVVEVGPGTGVLTRELLKRGAHVLALEADERAIHALQDTFSDEITAQKLTIFHTDVRTFDLSTLTVEDRAYKVVANIPYYLSGKLFRDFLTAATQPSCLVFLVQKEVARRIARDPKESLLSLSVKAFGTPRYVGTVSRGNFSPPPQVDSAIIAIDAISRKNFTELDEAWFFELLHLGFAAKRKQLVGNLTQAFDRELLLHTFSTIGLEANVRGEDLDINTWLTLARTLTPHRNSQ